MIAILTPSPKSETSARPRSSKWYVIDKWGVRLPQSPPVLTVDAFHELPCRELASLKDAWWVLSLRAPCLVATPKSFLVEFFASVQAGRPGVPVALQRRLARPNLLQNVIQELPVRRACFETPEECDLLGQDLQTPCLARARA